MTTTSTAASEREQPAVAVVEAALDRIGGGVRVTELAHKTGLTAAEVTDALGKLQRDGRPQPWAWTLSDQAQADAPEDPGAQAPRPTIARRRRRGRGAPRTAR